MADTAQPASQQGNLREAYSSTFTVVPLPEVYSSSILDGSEAVDPETELRIRFTAPVSETTLFDNIQITPLVTTTNVVSYTYSDLLREHQPEPDDHQRRRPAGLQHAPDAQLVP